MDSKVSEKQKVRLEVSRILEALAFEQFEDNSKLLSKNLFHFLNQEQVIHELIGAYAPFRREPIWFQALDAKKLRLAFPAIEEDQMVFRESSLDELVSKIDFGPKIMGPMDEMKLVTPTVLLIPGIAFTKNGERLGRGKGFFDKYLQNFKGKKIALGFECQIRESLPVESHDVKVDYLITEKDIYKF